MNPSPPSPAYLEYNRLMAELDTLIAAGADEGPEGAALRDRMDGPWYAMTDAEREWAGGETDGPDTGGETA